MVTADLLSRTRAGDGEAFRELAEPHRRELQDDDSRAELVHKGLIDSPGGEATRHETIGWAKMVAQQTLSRNQR